MTNADYIRAARGYERDALERLAWANYAIKVGNRKAAAEWREAAAMWAALAAEYIDRIEP